MRNLHLHLTGRGGALDAQLQGQVKQVDWLSRWEVWVPSQNRHPGSDLTNPIQESAEAWNQLRCFCKCAAVQSFLTEHVVCPRPKQNPIPKKVNFFFF